MAYLHRPWLTAERPKGGPGTANTTGHVLDVEHKEAFVILFHSFKADTLTTNIFPGRAVQCRLVVNTEDCIAIFVANVSLGLGS